jgi:hypothetical protein
MPSSPDQVLAVLSLLAEYYNHEPSEAQANIYLDALSDLDPSVLDDSARLWIHRSPFFPKVSELLEIARSVPAPTPDYLANQAQMLEDDFYYDRTLDPQAWLDLAEEFEKADRPHRALHTRQKLAAFLAILEQESRQDKERSTSALNLSPEEIEEVV